MRQWRLITDQPTTGPQNMAVDEALLRAVGAGMSLPTLRLYAWTPPCLSLGYAQKSQDVDFERLAQQGWQVVRRPTGGRAILHTDELTYSVTLPAGDDLAAGDVVESYRRISRALTAGLERLGLAVQSDQRAGRGESGPVCFETPSHYEITVRGRKLIGSAQLRRQHSILQHGSLPLNGDLGRICDALVYPDEASREQGKAQVRARAITMSEALGGTVITWTAAALAVIAGFAQTFALDFGSGAGELSPVEREWAEQLAAEVYTDVDWSRRRAT